VRLSILLPGTSADFGILPHGFTVSRVYNELRKIVLCYTLYDIKIIIILCTTSYNQGSIIIMVLRRVLCSMLAEPAHFVSRKKLQLFEKIVIILLLLGVTRCESNSATLVGKYMRKFDLIQTSSAQFTNVNQYLKKKNNTNFYFYYFILQPILTINKKYIAL